MLRGHGAAEARRRHAAARRTRAYADRAAGAAPRHSWRDGAAERGGGGGGASADGSEPRAEVARSWRARRARPRWRAMAPAASSWSRGGAASCLSIPLGEADAEELTARLDQRRVPTKAAPMPCAMPARAETPRPGSCESCRARRASSRRPSCSCIRSPPPESCAAALSLAPLRLSAPVWCSSLSRITYTFLSRVARASW